MCPGGSCSFVVRFSGREAFRRDTRAILRLLDETG
jgi:hypothetical protein